MNVPSELHCHAWTHHGHDCASNDWSRWQTLLLAAVQARGLTVRVLGQTAGEPIYFLAPTTASANKPQLLLASGFHGEEPAGPWGVLQFLQNSPEHLWAQANISLLPLVNVSGFKWGRRLNHLKQNPNRGFFAVNSGADGAVAGVVVTPSEEGEILQQHRELLLAAGRDGVLSCHEDVDVNYGYVYAYNAGPKPDAIACAVRDANAQFVPMHPDGEVDDCPVENGIVFNQYDGSLESWLMRLGATRALCTETPGLADFAVRVQANAAMMVAFVEQTMAR